MRVKREAKKNSVASKHSNILFLFVSEFFVNIFDKFGSSSTQLSTNLAPPHVGGKEALIAKPLY
jgi:hypothetical protein